MNPVEVQADGNVTWRFCQTLVLTVGFSFGVLATILVIVGVLPIGAAPVLVIVPTTAGLIVGVTVALYWKMGASRVVYRCDGSTLDALRNGKVVKSIACADIDNFEISGYISGASVLTYVGLPPSLPRLVADVRDRKRGIRTISFPEILLWGKEAATRADEILHECASSAGSPFET